MGARAAAMAKSAHRAAQSATHKSAGFYAPFSASKDSPESENAKLTNSEAGPLSPEASPSVGQLPVDPAGANDGISLDIPLATEGEMSAPLPSTFSAYSMEDMELEVRSEYSDTTRTVVWFIMSLSMFIAGLVMAIYGTVKVFDDSVISSALERFNVGSVGKTLKILFISALGLIGFFDILVVSNNSFLLQMLFCPLLCSLNCEFLAAANWYYF